MSYKLVTLGGDGTGPEVMREGLRVLHAISRRSASRGMSTTSRAAVSTTSSTATATGRRAPKRAATPADLILLGAVGWPSPTGSGPVLMKDGKMAGFSPVLGNRTRLNLYANVRPVKLYEGVQHRIHGQQAGVAAGPGRHGDDPREHRGAVHAHRRQAVAGRHAPRWRSTPA
jgi:isocitrate/isopropylmalate dehydrogenase